MAVEASCLCVYCISVSSVCCCAVIGVPLSNQWGQQGYFYPIQIAQYGLSHYSKYVKKKSSARPPLVVEDAEDGTTSRWTVSGGAVVSSVYDDDAQSRVIEFHTDGEY